VVWVASDFPRRGLKQVIESAAEVLEVHCKGLAVAPLLVLVEE